MTGAPCVNLKRVYRAMRGHQLLLRRLGQRRDTRRHDGRIATDRGNVRWCSEGFEFHCDNDPPLRVTFALDRRHQLSRDCWRSRIWLVPLSITTSDARIKHSNTVRLATNTSARR